MRLLSRILLFCVLALPCLSACNQDSVAVPDSLSGKVINRANGLPVQFATVEIFVFEKRLLNIPGPEGVPKDRIARLLSIKTDTAGNYFLDLSEYKDEVRKNYPDKTAALNSRIVVKAPGFEDAQVSYSGPGQLIELKESSRSR